MHSQELNNFPGVKVAASIHQKRMYDRKNSIQAPQWKLPVDLLKESAFLGAT